MKQGSKVCRALGEEWSQKKPGWGVCLAKSRKDGQCEVVRSQTMSDFDRDFEISPWSEGSDWRHSLSRELTCSYSTASIFLSCSLLTT